MPSAKYGTRHYSCLSGRRTAIKTRLWQSGIRYCIDCGLKADCSAYLEGILVRKKTRIHQHPLIVGRRAATVSVTLTGYMDVGVSNFLKAILQYALLGLNRLSGYCLQFLSAVWHFSG